MDTDGTWLHRHVNPLYLEKEIPKVKEGYINSKAYAEVWGNPHKSLGEYDIENLMDDYLNEEE